MDDWEAVAAAVERRRLALGLTQRQAAERGSVAIQTWNLIEGGGRTSYRALTIAGVCRALGWSDDSIDRILRGEEPEIVGTTVHVSDSDSATFTESESIVIEELKRYVDARIDAAMSRQSDRERRPESDREVTEDDFLDEPAPDD